MAKRIARFKAGDLVKFRPGSISNRPNDYGSAFWDRVIVEGILLGAIKTNAADGVFALGLKKAGLMTKYQEGVYSVLLTLHEDCDFTSPTTKSRYCSKAGAHINLTVFDRELFSFDQNTDLIVNIEFAL
jgi:hypothetical protein